MPLFEAYLPEDGRVVERTFAMDDDHAREMLLNDHRGKFAVCKRAGFQAWRKTGMAIRMAKGSPEGKSVIDDPLRA